MTFPETRMKRMPASGNTMPSDIKRMKRKKKIDDKYGTQLHAIYYSVFAIAYKWKKKQYEVITVNKQHLIQCK